MYPETANSEEVHHLEFNDQHDLLGGFSVQWKRQNIQANASFQPEWSSLITIVQKNGKENIFPNLVCFPDKPHVTSSHTLQTSYPSPSESSMEFLFSSAASQHVSASPSDFPSRQFRINFIHATSQVQPVMCHFVLSCFRRSTYFNEAAS